MAIFCWNLLLGLDLLRGHCVDLQSSLALLSVLLSKAYTPTESLSLFWISYKQIRQYMSFPLCVRFHSAWCLQNSFTLLPFATACVVHCYGMSCAWVSVCHRRVNVAGYWEAHQHFSTKWSWTALLSRALFLCAFTKEQTCYRIDVHIFNFNG